LLTILIGDFNAEPDYSLEEDEQLARAMQESLNTESPPHQHVPVRNVPSESIPTREPPQPVFPSSGYRYLLAAMVYLIFNLNKFLVAKNHKLYCFFPNTCYIRLMLQYVCFFSCCIPFLCFETQ
jgi:hypothetical protein